jgi:DNA-binding NarL/FixJ family response regulator
MSTTAAAAEAAAQRSPGRSGAVLAPGLGGVAAAVAPARLVWSTPLVTQPHGTAAMKGLLVGCCVAVGMYTWSRRPSSPPGLLVAGAGFLYDVRSQPAERASVHGGVPVRAVHSAGSERGVCTVSAERPIRVVVGEDSFLAREAISALLSGTDGVELVATCEDVDTLRATIEEERPDVVLTDIRMPPGNRDEGIRLGMELRETQPEVGVVVLSQHAEPAYATLLFEHGSEGRAYLLKESLKDRAELVRALRTVADGGSVVDPLVVERLIANQKRREATRLASLTPRELEVLKLIAEGASNARIGKTLFVTKRAVERHINSIFLKLGLRAERDISRRVKAALLFLSGETGEYH